MLWYKNFQSRTNSAERQNTIPCRTVKGDWGKLIAFGKVTMHV